MTTLSRSASSQPGANDDVIRVLGDDGTLDPRLDPELSSAEVIELYRHMVRTRFLDERLVALQRQGRIGFHVGSLGEEAAILGSAFAMRKADWIFPCYREAGAALMRGLPLQTFMDNLFGNKNDTARGRQMPDHYTFREGGWGSISSPVGTQITQAVGFAWAAKIQHKDVATLVYFGDGATSSSDFHNGLNFAGVFTVSTIFFCRNNGWAISVPVERQTASRSFAVKGVAYGVPGYRVDGNDLFAVVSVTRRALERCMAGEGPTLIEALTYRMGGHSTSDDPNRYRGTEQLKPWEKRDPIERVRHYLDVQALWDDQKEESLRAQLEFEFRKAVEVSEETPPPSLESMFDDVYSEPPWHLVEQRKELLEGPRPETSH